MPDGRIHEGVEGQCYHDGRGHHLRGQADDLIVEDQQEERVAALLDRVRGGARRIGEPGLPAERRRAR
jgi:hypothetical protein